MSTGSGGAGAILAPRRFWAGAFLIGLGLFVFWANARLSQGTFRMMGPAMFPRILGGLVGLGGAVLVALSFRHPGEPLERFALRGPVFVTLAVVAFALTIRPLGLGPASFLALVFGGLATPDAKPRELVPFALITTVLSVLLFHYFLGMAGHVLAIPGTGIRI